MEEEEIVKKFMNDPRLSEQFYRGSKRLPIAEIVKINVVSVKEGDFHNGCNYEIEGRVDFYETLSGGDKVSNGEENFEALIKVEGDEIETIDRINIENHK